MSERLEAPLREIVGHRVDDRGVVMLHLACGHVTAAIGRAPSGPDRKRCDRCAPVTRAAATTAAFLATDTITGGDVAAASPPLAATLASPSRDTEPRPLAVATTRRPSSVQAGTSPDQTFARGDAVPAVLSLTVEQPPVPKRAAAGRRR